MEGDAVDGVTRDADYVDSWGARLRGSSFEKRSGCRRCKRASEATCAMPVANRKLWSRGSLSSTPDGFLINQPHDALAEFGIADIGAEAAIVVEAKTIDPRARLDDAKPEHSYQTRTQLGLFREVTSHRPDYAVISYSDASFWNETTEFAVKFDPQVFANAKHRAAAIMLAARAADLKPEGWISGGRECEYCPFTRACGRARTSFNGAGDGEADPAFIAEMISLARQAKYLEIEADTTSANLRELQNAIREKLRAKGVRRIAADGVKINWSAVKGRATYDNSGIRSAAAAAGVDAAKFETVADSSDRLVIQVIDR